MENQMNVPKLRFQEFSDEWKKKNLGVIAKFSKGKGVSKSEIAEDGLIECVRYGELYTRYGEVIDEVFSKTNVGVKHLVVSEANDVIIPASGETQIDIATASCVIKSGIALGGDLNIIKSSCNGVFLSYYLNNKKKTAIANLAQGISVVHLYPSQLSLLELNLPQITEQTKIATFITAIADKITQLKKKKSLLEQYKKGVMQQLFSQELRFKDEDGNDYADWKDKMLGEVGKFVGGGTPSTKVTENWNGCIPWISSSDLTENSIFRINASRFVSEEAITNSATKVVPANSVIIVSRVGVGKVAVNESDLCTSQDFTSLIPYKDHPIFLAYLVKLKTNSLLGFNQGTSIKGFVKSDLETMKIELPSLPEQQKIASFLTALDDKIAQTALQIEKMQLWKKGLLQQMFV